MDMDDEVSPADGAQAKPDLALDLNFVPTWARQPPENPYVGREDDRGDDRGRPPRRDDRRGPFGARPGGDRRGPRPGGPRPEGGFRRGPGAPRPGGAGPRPGGPGPRREGGDRFARPRFGDDRRGPRRDDRRPPRESLPRLDVKVTFLPDRERLALVVRDIQASRRAFPLIEIANRFLSREDLYLVKLELMPPAPAAEGAPRPVLTQCLECKRVFRQRANAEAHLLHDHLDKYFAVEETEVEPPAGAFTCVARCGLSGTLLGPPNHHGYNEKIQELWSARFAHLSKAEYLGHVETVRDEALVEQWKDALRKKTVYRLKEVPEGQEAAPMSRAEAQDWMRAGKLNPLLRESARCLVPGPQSKKFDDGSLRSAVSLAWQKETRFPFTLSLALRPAFRHMKLYLFKVNARETYVTAVAPTPVDPAAAPAIAKEILDYLEAHAGATRQQVLDGMRPGADPESAAAAELLLHLNNLIATGGAIEFFNGTLVLPRGGARPEGKPAAGEQPAPDESPAEEAPAAAAETEAAEPAPPAPEPAAAAPVVPEEAAAESAPGIAAEESAAEPAAEAEVRPE